MQITSKVFDSLPVFKGMQVRFKDGAIYYVIGADFDERLYHLNEEMEHSDDSFWARCESCRIIEATKPVSSSPIPG